MKLKIEGLNCEICAKKIEKMLKRRPEINSAKVDIIGQNICFEAPKEVNIGEIKQEIKKIEPCVKFLEEGQKEAIYNLEGVTSKRLGMKLEKKLRNQKMVTDAKVDFKNEKLILTYDEKNFSLIKKITNEVDDKIIISKNEKVKIKKSKKINYEILVSLFISIILIAITFLIPMNENIKTIILILAYLISGYDILIKLVKNLFKLELFDENFLMGVATIAAFSIGEHLEAIAVMIFYKLGEFFQDMAVNQSRESISELMDIKPEFANLKTKNGYEIVDPKNVKINDTIIVKPGEKIPLDGIVTEGNSYIDNKALTGESVNVKVKKGSVVLSGSINKDSIIKIKVNKEYNDSTVAKILDLVENSSANKAPTENFITKFARVYTPIVVVLALLVAIIPPLTFSNEGLHTWIYRAVVFLVISCPCALVISIPLGYFAGIGNASRNGILVKGANYLEALNDVESVVMDKTGTLTHGNFKVTQVVPYNKISEKELLKTAAYAEEFSNHPIAVSIKESYQHKIDPKVIADYKEVAGQGVKVKIKKDTILAGNYKMMEKNHIRDVEKMDSGTIIYLAKNKEYLGYLVVEDEVKENSIQGLQELRDLGIQNLVMLTGDSELMAQNVAQKVGLTQYFAKLLPNDKVNKFEEIEQKKAPNSKIIFVGDGINDAPVLSRADIGIAMGGVGSDAAIESADIVIMNDEISKIPLAIKIARKTQRIVKENIILSMTVKLLAMFLGVLGIATIWQAVIADVGVAIVAILNSMRVLNNKN